MLDGNLADLVHQEQHWSELYDDYLYLMALGAPGERADDLRQAARDRARQQHWTAQELIDLWQVATEAPVLTSADEERASAGYWLRYPQPLVEFDRAHAHLYDGGYGPHLDDVRRLIEEALL